MGKLAEIGVLWRRLRVSIIFPVLSFSAIYADYSHTQKYKNELKQQQQNGF
jgi:hypothetical protein